MGGRGNMPHINGYALTDTPLAMIRAGNYNKVTFMAGSNKDEFGSFMKLQNDLRVIRPGGYEQGLVDQFKFSEADAKSWSAFTRFPSTITGRWLLTGTCSERTRPWPARLTKDFWQLPSSRPGPITTISITTKSGWAKRSAQPIHWRYPSSSMRLTASHTDFCSGRIWSRPRRFPKLSRDTG